MGALTDTAHRRHPIQADEDVGALRRSVAALAPPGPGVRAGDAELIATELATNVLRHGGPGGYVLSRAWDEGLELLAVDSGPGVRGDWRLAASAIPPPDRPISLQRGGLGVGLAGVERLASTFDLYSQPGAGTVVLARLLSRPPPALPGLRWSGVSVPRDDGADSGDAWSIAVDGERLGVLLVDGLGHGAAAHGAAAAALAVFHDRPLRDLEDFVRRAHEAMLPTRGGVLGVVLIDAGHGQLTFAGVGNITARLLRRGRSEPLLSREGTMGTEIPLPRVRVIRLPWGPGASLLLTSDGIGATCDPLSYPGLLEHDPAVVAATLVRDHWRRQDDASALVVQDVR